MWPSVTIKFSDETIRTLGISFVYFVFLFVNFIVQFQFHFDMNFTGEKKFNYRIVITQNNRTKTKQKLRWFLVVFILFFRSPAK